MSGAAGSEVEVREQAPARREPSDPIAQALAAGQSALDEHEGKRLLSSYGLKTPAGTVVHTADEAVGVLTKLRGPLVLKALGPDIQHKSDLGLVALDLASADSVRDAFCRIVERVGERLHGVLVEEMVPHERELLIGMRRDESFGPVVAFGLGGVFAEALRDVAFALAPLDDRDADRLSRGLRAQRLLGPLRGLSPVDRGALADILKTVGQIAVDHPQIAEIDVNPLMVAGAELIAGDALIVLADDSSPCSGKRRVARPCPTHFDSVFIPSSIAVVGASGDPRKWGGSLLRNVIEGGFAGRVYPVNPRGGEFLGLPVYGSLADLPETPELVLVVLGAAQTGEVVAECARLDVPAVVAIAAGYSEAGPEGKRMEDELAATAQSGGSTLVGPNCMGVLCGSSRLNAVGFVTLRPQLGPVSVISQSGNIGTQMLMAAERRGIGIEKFISVGNQACSTAVDVLDHLGHDQHTEAVIMYVEEVDDGRRFFEVARRTTARKPVVVIRGGSTAAGSRAAASHTGAMAGSTDVFMAAARQAGAILSDDADESLDIAAALAYLPLPRGRRVGVVTLGGGWGVLAADELARSGLGLAGLPASVMARIDELLPAFWSHGNPVDLVASVAGETPEEVLRLVAESETVDAVIALALLGSPSSGRDRQGTEGDGLNDAELAMVRCLAQTMERTAKPIIAVPLCPVAGSVFEGHGEYAPLVLPTPRAAVLALSRMVEYADHLGLLAPTADDAETDRAAGVDVTAGGCGG